MPPLTPRQSEVLEAVREYRYREGMSCTLQELADKLGISKIATREHLIALRDKGYIRWTKSMSRTIEILDGKAYRGTTKLRYMGVIDCRD